MIAIQQVDNKWIMRLSAHYNLIPNLVPKKNLGTKLIPDYIRTGSF